MMGDAIEESGGQLGGPEHRRPFPGRQVGRDDDAGLLVKFASQMEQQLPALTGEGKIAKLIEHDEVEARELGGKRAAFADPGFRFEAGHQIHGVEVAPPRSSTNDIGGDGDGQMILYR